MVYTRTESLYEQLRTTGLYQHRDKLRTEDTQKCDPLSRHFPQILSLRRFYLHRSFFQLNSVYCTNVVYRGLVLNYEASVSYCKDAISLNSQASQLSIAFTTGVFPNCLCQHSSCLFFTAAQLHIDMPISSLILTFIKCRMCWVFTQQITNGTFLDVLRDEV